MRVFFSHPISTYCTDQEDAALETLQQAGYSVINPSDAPVQASCGPDMTKWAALAASADALAFLPFPDGRIGAGVVMEVTSAQEAGRPLFALSPDGRAMRPVTDWPRGFDLVDMEETRVLIRAFKTSRAEQGLPPIPTRPETPTTAARKPRP